MPWSPEQYLKFADHRLRPAVDLLGRVGCEDPRLVYDLGCGAGNVTRLLRRRWPGAQIVGVDSSAEMLASARKASSGDGEVILWQQADLNGWVAERPADVIFSNAALHWLDGHQVLFVRLFDAVAPGGVLAVQMPNNFGEPSHTALAESARAVGRWAALQPRLRSAPVHSAAFYWGVLTAAGGEVDIWETMYMHALAGDDPVVQWTLGSVLRPLLDVLDEAGRQAFLADYGRRMAEAYPKRPDGTTLFPFRRMFIVARKPE